MARIYTRKADIQLLDYSPQASYPLDLDVFPISDLRQRGSKEKVRTTHRYAFHMLVCVTKGTCTQLVDLKPVRCGAGSLLFLRPSQLHNFGREEDWDGWIMLFRSEFLLTSSVPARDLHFVVDLEQFPEHMRLSESEMHNVVRAILQMREDTKTDAPPDAIHALLRFQVYALLSRLNIFLRRRESSGAPNNRELRLFKRFRHLVERHFFRRHRVAEYAGQLGCTERSLTRATTAAAGMNAKSFIAVRINLEAKRLLVHTDMPVTLIAEKLGFGEATNFTKFFRRDTGCTPSQFRLGKVADGSRH
jgi:AraC-like DNA-binding protein